MPKTIMIEHDDDGDEVIRKVNEALKGMFPNLAFVWDEKTEDGVMTYELKVLQ